MDEDPCPLDAYRAEVCKSLKETYYGVFTTSKHSIKVPENIFLKRFAGNSF